MKKNLLIACVLSMGLSAHAYKDPLAEQVQQNLVMLFENLENENQELEMQIAQIDAQLAELTQQIEEQYNSDMQDALEKSGQEKIDAELKALEQKNLGLAFLDGQLQEKNQLQAKITENIGKMLEALLASQPNAPM